MQCCGRSFANLLWFWGDGRAQQCRAEIGWRGPACPSPPASRQREGSKPGKQETPTQSGNASPQNTAPLAIPDATMSFRKHGSNQQEKRSPMKARHACIVLLLPLVLLLHFFSPAGFARTMLARTILSPSPRGKVSDACMYTWASPAIHSRAKTNTPQHAYLSPRSKKGGFALADVSDMLRPFWRL